MNEFTQQEKENILDYLKILINISQNILLRDQLITKLKEKANSLAIIKEPFKPTKPKLPNIEKNNFFRPLVFTLIIDCFITFILVQSMYNWHNSPISGLFAILFLLAIPVTIFIVINTFIDLGSAASKQRKEETEYKKKLERYNDEIKEYELQLEENKKKYNEEIIEKDYIESEILNLEKENKDSENRLNQLLNSNIIYKKYRELPCLCLIHEYIDSGRSNTLGEAYDRVEEEFFRKEHLLNQKQMIRDLESIKGTQYLYYQTMKDINNNLEDLLYSSQSTLQEMKELKNKTEDQNKYLNELKEHSKVISFNNKQTLKEIQYLNDFNYYLEKGRFPNRY